MLKTSLKKEKLRNFIFYKNYTFYVSNFIKFFLVKKYSHIWLKPLWRKMYKNNFTFSSFTKISSICLLTGRSRSVYRLFKLSRLKIRTYSKYGFFIGLSKASW